MSSRSVCSQLSSMHIMLAKRPCLAPNWPNGGTFVGMILGPTVTSKITFLHRSTGCGQARASPTGVTPSPSPPLPPRRPALFQYAHPPPLGPTTRHNLGRGGAKVVRHNPSLSVDL